MLAKSEDIVGWAQIATLPGNDYFGESQHSELGSAGSAALYVSSLVAARYINIRRRAELSYAVSIAKKPRGDHQGVSKDKVRIKMLT